MFPQYASIALFLAALPFCVIAAVTDLRTMKILNKTNIGLFATFMIVGLFVVPLPEYGIRILQAAVMMAVGIALMATRQMGGGDAKFLAAMAPYIALSDAPKFLMLLSAMALVTLALHRLIGAVPAVRPMLVNFHSWDASQSGKGMKGKFPYGVTLGVSLSIYLALQL